jgi:integrase/recombinase XerD
LWDTGIRIGEALGLRHEDLAAAEGEMTVKLRANDNGARVKSATPRTIPVSPEVIRLYAAYPHGEYGDLDYPPPAAALNKGARLAALRSWAEETSCNK